MGAWFNFRATAVPEEISFSSYSSAVVTLTLHRTKA